jgi:hypothetical protein
MVLQSKVFLIVLLRYSPSLDEKKDSDPPDEAAMTQWKEWAESMKSLPSLFPSA